VPWAGLKGQFVPWAGLKAQFVPWAGLKGTICALGWSERDNLCLGLV
jgi:hypothetical protein